VEGLGLLPLLLCSPPINVGLGFANVKEVDRSSADLATKCSAGEHISEVTLEVTPAGGNEREYLVIEMTYDDNASMRNVAPVCGAHARRKKEGADGARRSCR